jgi:hypothetical protein
MYNCAYIPYMPNFCVVLHLVSCEIFWRPTPNLQHLLTILHQLAEQVALLFFCPTIHPINSADLIIYFLYILIIYGLFMFIYLDKWSFTLEYFLPEINFFFDYMYFIQYAVSISHWFNIYFWSLWIYLGIFQLSFWGGIRRRIPPHLRDWFTPTRVFFNTRPISKTIDIHICNDRTIICGAAVTKRNYLAAAHQREAGIPVTTRWTDPLHSFLRNPGSLMRMALDAGNCPSKGVSQV